MKTKTIVLTLLTGLLTAGAAFAAETNLFKSDKEKLSYALGMGIANNLKRANFEVDLDVLFQELKDAMAGVPTRLTEQEASQVISAYQMEKRKQLLEKNKKEGDAFLEANKTKPGVISLPNGLQYKILAEGSGESPKPEDTVEVNYRGTLVDGTEFDSNAKSGQPYTTAANRVIRGWTEALTRMKPGAKWQLFIPSDLAYGERGFGQKIAPNNALLFDLELVSFKPAPPAPSAPAIAQPLTSDIIKVPSLEEMKKGAKIETIKAEDVEKLQKQQAGKPKEEKPKEEKK